VSCEIGAAASAILMRAQRASDALANSARSFVHSGDESDPKIQGEINMALIKFDDYAKKYQHIKMERRDGILQMTLHTNDAELKWGMGPHEELSYAFNDIARDHENRCVIMTGTGEAFCAEVDAGKGSGAGWCPPDDLGPHLQ
jgi:hypothetical protein